MRLYRLLLPKAETCLDYGLYYHVIDAESNTLIDVENGELHINKGVLVNFDSYYNSFSIEKWSKYTILDNLRLVLEIKGKFIVTLFRHKLAYREITTEALGSYTVDTKERSKFSFEYPMLERMGVFSFSLVACNDDSCFYGGEYCTEIDDTSLRNVNIAVTMCTYHREAYIKRNLALLNNAVFNNSDSPLHDHLRLYIADNGQSLVKEEVENNYVSIYPQQSYGGAGGFVRGILEILNTKEKKTHTHILIMDDDVIIEPEGLVRNYSLLRLIKEEYKDRQIGGAMLRADRRYVQYEASGQFKGFGIKSIKPDRDLRDLLWVLDNEKEETHNYQAWFYSCIPIDVYLDNGFSLPLFMKGDDVEYGLRQKQSITLNGIAVWHEPFESKDTFVSKYFCVRNETIVGCMHNMLDKKRVIKELQRAFKWHILCYQFKAFDMHCRALEDFCKGIDWLEKLNARQYYAELQAADYQRIPIDQLGIAFDYNELFTSMFQNERKLKQWIRRLTFNGWFFPTKKSSRGNGTIIPMTRCRIINFYRVKKAVFYNDYNGTAYVSERSYKLLYKAIKDYFRIRNLINKQFDRVKQEYISRKSELTQRAFWENYLDLDKK